MAGEATVEQPDLIAAHEAARRLGVPGSTWRYQVRTGAAPRPTHWIGQRGYYRRADLEAFVATGKWPRAMEFRAGD
jgi:hypothetical protein